MEGHAVHASTFVFVIIVAHKQCTVVHCDVGLKDVLSKEMGENNNKFE
jgi:hypothetical protein